VLPAQLDAYRAAAAARKLTARVVAALKWQPEADLAVLDRDLFDPGAGPVGDARVLATFVEGAVVHAMKDRRSRRRSTRHLEGQPSTRA